MNKLNDIKSRIPDIEKALEENVPDEVWDQIKEEMDSDPMWYSKYHFGWGMAVRNLLRREVCSDKELPSSNWDDYYIEAIERVVNKRNSND